VTTPNINQHVAKDLRKLTKAAVKAGWRLEFVAGRSHGQRCQLVSSDGARSIPLSGAGSHSGGPAIRQSMNQIRRALS
jgi:hypothetical protein